MVAWKTPWSPGKTVAFPEINALEPMTLCERKVVQTGKPIQAFMDLNDQKRKKVRWTQALISPARTTESRYDSPPIECS